MVWDILRQQRLAPRPVPLPQPRQPSTQRKPGEEWTKYEIGIRGAGRRVRDFP